MPSYEVELPTGERYLVEADRDLTEDEIRTQFNADRQGVMPAAAASQSPEARQAASAASTTPAALAASVPGSSATGTEPTAPRATDPALSPAALDAIMLQWPGFGGTPGFPEPSTGDTARGQAGSAKIGWLRLRQIPPAFEAMIEAGARETARRHGLPREPSPEEMGLTQPSTKPEESQSLAPWRSEPFKTPVEGKPDRAPLDVSPAVRKLAELEAAKRGVYRSEAQKRLAAATTMGAKFKAWIHDPVELTSSIILESLPSSLAGGLIGGAAGPTGLAMGIGLSSFAATAASELVGAAEQLGYKMSDPAQADAFFRSPEFADAASGVMQKAAVVGGIDAATSRVAGRWLGPAMSQGLRQRVGAVGKEMGLQMLGGGGGEALGALAGGETPDLFDVFSEVVAEIAPGEAAANIATQGRQAAPAQDKQPAGQRMAQETAAPAQGEQPPGAGRRAAPEDEPITPDARGLIKVHPIPTTTAEVRKAIEEAPTLQALADIVVDPGVKQLAAGLSPVENAGLTALVQDRVAALEAAQARAETERAAIAATGAPSVSGQAQGPMAATKEEAAAGVSPAREVLPPTTTAEVRQFIKAAPTLQALADIVADPGVRQLAAGLSPVENAGLQTLVDDRVTTLQWAQARAENERAAIAATGAPSVSSQGQGPMAATKEEAAAGLTQGETGRTVAPAAEGTITGPDARKGAEMPAEPKREPGPTAATSSTSQAGTATATPRGQRLYTFEVAQTEMPAAKERATVIPEGTPSATTAGGESVVQTPSSGKVSLPNRVQDTQTAPSTGMAATGTVDPTLPTSLTPRPASQQPEPPDQQRIQAVAQMAREEGAKEGEFTVIWAPNWVLTDKDGRQFWVEGAPQDGGMILNAAVPTMANRANVRRVVREERTHLALISEEGRRLVRDFIGRYLTDAVRQQLAKQGYTRERYRSDEEYDRAIAEEFIAKQARENTPLWRRLVDLVRRWLAERGLANLTAEEAARGIIASLRRSPQTAEKRPTIGRASLAEQPFEEIAKKFREDMSRTRLGSLPADQSLQLGQTSPALQAAGLPAGPIYIKQQTLLEKPKDPSHVYPIQKLMRLPEALQDPVLVHESWTHPDSFVALLDFSHEGKNLAAALHFRTTRDGVEVTEVASVYPRTAGQILDAIRRTGTKGGVTYYHEQKVRDWLAHSSGFNSPQQWVQLLGRANLPTNRKPRQGPPGLSLAPVTPSQAPRTVPGAVPRATAQPGAVGSAAPGTATAGLRRADWPRQSAAAAGAAMAAQAGLPPLPVMDRETGRYAYPPHTEQHRLAEELDSLNLWSLTPKPGPIGTTPGPHATDPNRSVFPIQLPEAVEFMAAILGGKFPRLRAQIRALKGLAAGVAKFKGEEAEIELRRDLWALDTETIERLRQEAASYAQQTAQRDGLGAAMQGRLEREKLDHLIKEEARTNPPTTALKTLWHEIGHIVDWLPDKTLKRGNILGHLATLKKYLQPTLPMGPGIPHRPLTQDEQAKLRKTARQELEAEMGTWREIIERIKVEEPIYETLNITPDTIKAMFGMDAREQFPELYLWFASQPDEVKVQIVKAAMKGMVDPRAAGQGGQRMVGKRVVEQEVRRRVPAKGKPTQAEIVERFRKLLREEMDRRQQVDLETVKQELSDLIAWWRGTDQIEDYFKTAGEMYAEAYSVFMNNPAAVAARAPYYYRLLQNYMERKPEVAAKYNEIMDRARAGTVMADRVQRLREAWRKADADALAWREESRTLREKATDLLDNVSYHLVRRFGPIFRRARRSGTPDRVREAIGDYVYRATDHERLLGRVNHEVGVPLVAANLDWNDLGEYMFHKHITENRFVHDPVTGILRPIANPEGWTADTSMVRLAEMERDLGPERWATLVRAQQAFRAIYEQMVVAPIAEEGMYSPELMRAITERVFYATFQAVQQQPEHSIEKLLDTAFGTGVGAGIYRQVGQLGHVKQPATTTVLKALSLITAIRRNAVAREIVALMLEVEPEMIKEAQWKWVNNRMEPVLETTPTVGTIIFLKEGKLQAYYVPRLVADSVSHGNPTTFKPVVVLMRATSFLKGLMTQLNPAFWPVSVARDLIAWGMQLPGVTAPAQYFKYMPGALRASYAYLRGRPNALADLAMDRRMKISRMDPTDYAEISNEYDMTLAAYGIQPAQWSKEVGRLSALRKFWEAYKSAGQISEFAHKIAGMKYLDDNFPDMPEWKKQEIVRERAGSPDFLQKPAASGYMDLVALFVNPWKEGLISLVKSAKENPWSFTAKSTALVLAPTVLQAMAASGWLGDDVEEMYASVSDYDLVNYLVIPLWWEDRAQRKVGYLRLPLWDPARIVHAALQRMLTGRGGGAQGISAQVAGSVPGWSPILDVVTGWIQYEAFGVNPTDGYTGRPWLDSTTFQAGGWPGFREMAKRTYNELGGSVIYRMRQSRPDDVDRTAMEKVLQAPGVQQLLGRWIKISNQGILDQDRKFGTEVAERRANLRLAGRQVIEKLVLHEPLSHSERQIMRDPYVMEYVRRGMREAVKNRSSLVQRRLSRAQTREEKQRILKAEAALRSAPGPAPVGRPK